MSKLILFDGYLAQMYPEGIRVEARSAAEAISALQNYPGFREEDGVQHQVMLPDFASHDAIFLPTDKEIIEVVPILEGAGGKPGVLQIVIGVVLIVAGFWTGGATWSGLFTSAGGLSAAGSMVAAGAMMVLGGVMTMMMPQPTMGGNENEKQSNILAANKNTVAIGTPIPLIFGTRRVWPHLMTYNVTATNLQEPAPVAPPQTSAVVASSEHELDYSNWHNSQWGGA